MPLNANARIGLVAAAIGLGVAAECVFLTTVSQRNAEAQRTQRLRAVSVAPGSEGGAGQENVPGEPSLAGSRAPSHPGSTASNPAPALPQPLSTPAPPPQNAEAKRLFDEGTAAIKANDGAKALAAFQGALKLEPKNLGVLSQLTSVYMGLNRPKDAIPHLKTLISLAPKDAAAHFELGRAYAATKALPQAEAELRQAIKLNPKVKAGYGLLGDVLLAEHKAKDAYALWKSVAARDPKDTEARLRAAQVANDFLKQPAQAEKWLREANAIPNGDSRPAILLGQMLMSQRKAKDAAQVLAAAVKRNPKNLELYPSLAAARSAAGDVNGAAGALKAAIDRSPNPASLPAGRPRQMAVAARTTLFIDLGRLLGNAKRLKEARDAFQSAVTLMPNEADPYSFLAKAQLGLKDTSGAIKSLTKALQLDPKRPEDRFLLASAFAEAKHWDKADASYATLVKLAPKNPQIYLAWANMWNAAKQPEKEVGVWQELAKLVPKDPMPPLQIGAIYRDLGKNTEAEAYFRQAQKLDPNDSNALFELAKLEAKSNPGAAVTNLKKLVALNPEFPPGYIALIEAATKAGQTADARDAMAALLAKKPEEPLRLRVLTEVLKYYDEHKQPGEAKQLLAAIVAKNPKASSAKTALDSFGVPTTHAGDTPAPPAAAP